MVVYAYHGAVCTVSDGDGYKGTETEPRLASLAVEVLVLERKSGWQGGRCQRGL